MAENPYAAPRTRVEDAPTTLPDGDFIPEGRGVPAGNGWRWITDAWAFMAEQRWTFIGVFVLLIVLMQDRCAASCRSSARSRSRLLSPVHRSAGSCSAAKRCAAASRSRSGTCSPAFSGTPASSSALGAISLAFASSLAAIIMVAIVGRLFPAADVGGAEPNPEEVMGMLVPLLLAVLVILALSLPLYDGDVVRDAADRAARRRCRSRR